MLSHSTARERTSHPTHSYPKMSIGCLMKACFVLRRRTCRRRVVQWLKRRQDLLDGETMEAFGKLSLLEVAVELMRLPATVCCFVVFLMFMSSSSQPNHSAHTTRLHSLNSSREQCISLSHPSPNFATSPSHDRSWSIQFQLSVHQCQVPCVRRTALAIMGSRNIIV